MVPPPSPLTGSALLHRIQMQLADEGHQDDAPMKKPRWMNRQTGTVARLASRLQSVRLSPLRGR